MTIYTLGIIFTPDLKEVVLIKKARPEWQAGHYNFPGGKSEEDTNTLDGKEEAIKCISREIKEETGLNIKPKAWLQIGMLRNSAQYLVWIYTTQIDKSELFYDPAEPCAWYPVDNMPAECLPNLKFLLPFAIATYGVYNADGANHPDQLVHGVFEYTYK